MSANVESMFSVREIPWHGLGTIVQTAPNVREVLTLAGIDWNVLQSDVVPYTQIKKIVDDIQFAMLMGKDVKGYLGEIQNLIVPGYKLNYRETDNQALGIVTNRYKVVQNIEALEFIDCLASEGATFETAGSLDNGKRIFITMKLKEQKITDEDMVFYLVITNSHDGKGAVTVCITPVRVVCQNTLNLALRQAVRSFSFCHKGDIKSKLLEAKLTLENSDNYITHLEEEFGELKLIKMDEDKVWEYLKLLFPIDGTETDKKTDWMTAARLEVYNDWKAPDLADREKSAFRFINAVSDFATHNIPLKKTKTFQEKRFARTIDGNPLIDKAYELVGALR